MSSPRQIRPRRIFAILSGRATPTLEEVQTLASRGDLVLSSEGYSVTEKGNAWRGNYLLRAGNSAVIYHPYNEHVAAAILGQVAGMLAHFDHLDDFQAHDECYLDDETHRKAQKSADDGIAKRQHIIAERHLYRFAADFPTGGGHTERKVWTYRCRYNEVRALTPSAGSFCRPRLWTHTAEHHWLKWAEDALLDEADDPVGLARHREGQEIITEYWAMCRARAEVANIRIRPLKHHNKTRIHFTQDERDRLSRRDIGAYSDVGDETQVIAASLVRGRMRLHSNTASNREIRWGVVRANGWEFALPDRFPFFIVPLDPSTALVGYGRDSRYREERDVSQTEIAFDPAGSAKDFTVARSECVIRRIQENQNRKAKAK